MIVGGKERKREKKSDRGRGLGGLLFWCTLPHNTSLRNVDKVLIKEMEIRRTSAGSVCGGGVRDISTIKTLTNASHIVDCGQRAIPIPLSNRFTG